MRRMPWVSVVVGLFTLLAPGGAPSPASDPAVTSTLPSGFSETVAFSGLTAPTVVRFASDGRVFVAEKSGVIKVFSGLDDPTPTVFADLSVNVHDFFDRGLLGLALHPSFPGTPYVYVAYTYDHMLGSPSPPPRWGDDCPTPPGPTGDGCVVSGRVSRLQAAGDVMTGSEQVLVEDWCQQYPSHSLGTVEFGPDGALYVSAGDGAGDHILDWGQDGNPLNPCGDPPGGVGVPLIPPTAEGGALRSQDLRTPLDPATLDGTIIRVDPVTGAGLPSNPLFGSSDPNARRIIAHGLRNPFRFSFRPGTSELWVGDVGSAFYEEINRILSPTDATVENFGWPCYENGDRHPGYDSVNLLLCETLYLSPSADTEPYFDYSHSGQVVPGEACPSGGSSLSGLAFNAGFSSSFPAEYQGALFFADYSRDCIWAMKTGGGSTPSPAHLETFVSGASNPVNLQFGPGGDLFYPDAEGGTIRRVHFDGAAPTVLSTTPPNGATGVPLGASPTAVFSEDMDPATLTTSTFRLVEQGTGTPLAATVSYDAPTRTATLDPTASLESNAAYTATVFGGPSGAKDLGGSPLAGDVSWSFQTNRPPTPVITAPAPTTTWEVGQLISFSGDATDPEQGTLPPSALSWALVLQHCPSGCHAHTVQTWPGVASGSFNAPDHEYPSFLELRLTATDAGEASASTTLELDPRTVALTFQSSPSSLSLSVGDIPEATPFTRTVIEGSANTISATTPQILGETTYEFSSWSDGGAQTHTIAASTSATYTANYVIAPPQNTAPPRITQQLSYPPVLATENGDWSGSVPMTFSYEWLRCSTLDVSSCVPIVGATARSYVALPTDVGFRLRSKVTGTNAGGSGSGISEATPPI